MLLPTGVAVSVEDVEARKEDGHLEGWDYGVRASPCREEVQVCTRVDCSMSRSQIRLLGMESLSRR